MSMDERMARFATVSEISKGLAIEWTAAYADILSKETTNSPAHLSPRIMLEATHIQLNAEEE